MNQNMLDGYRFQRLSFGVILVFLVHLCLVEHKTKILKPKDVVDERMVFNVGNVTLVNYVMFFIVFLSFGPYFVFYTLGPKRNTKRKNMRKNVINCL